jgi:hypothetical protein
MRQTLQGPTIKVGFGDCEPDDVTGDDWMNDLVDQVADKECKSTVTLAEWVSETADKSIRVGVLHFADLPDAVAWMIVHADDSHGLRSILRAIDANAMEYGRAVIRRDLVQTFERDAAARMDD